MTFGRKTKRIFASLLLVLAIPIGVSAYWFLKNKSHRFFRASSDASVTLNGVSQPNASLYRSDEGVWLIDLDQRNEWYAYTREDARLYTCKRPRHLPLPRSLLHIYDDSLPCVGFNDLKAFNPNLTVTAQSIEFDSHEHRGRIRVTWF